MMYCFDCHKFVMDYRKRQYKELDHDLHFEGLYPEETPILALHTELS